MNLLLTDAIRIPGKATQSLRAFRRWTTSGQYPERGDCFYLAGDIWMDNSMETLLHNQIKNQIAAVLTLLIGRLGIYCADRMRLVNVAADISCEPDGMFISHESRKEGRVHWAQGGESLEVIGSPDMVLEVVSPGSIQKDTVLLRELYAAAGIAEYWLLNPLGEAITFDILRLSGRAYASVRKAGGWLKSPVFGKTFRLSDEEPNPEFPEYRLLVR